VQLGAQYFDIHSGLGMRDEDGLDKFYARILREIHEITFVGRAKNESPQAIVVL